MFSRHQSCSSHSYLLLQDWYMFHYKLLNPTAHHTSFILIYIQHPSEKLFPPIHKAKSLLKNSSCGPDTAINGPGPSSEYTGCPNIVDALVLINLSTMAPLVFPRSLSTVVANDVSKFSTIKISGGVSFPTFLFAVPWEKCFWCQLHPWTWRYCYVLGI